MASVFDKLVSRQLISGYPSFMKNNIHYEAVVGSVAFGVSQDESDIDVCGFAMPPKHILFPYHHGHIYGFGPSPQTFKQFQIHHIFDKTDGKEYDIQIYSIVRYFQLCMGANPNMVDSLFVPQRCVLSCSQMGEYVRENRKIFLSKLCWHKFKGYAYSQLSKMNDKVGREFVTFCEHYDFPLDITKDDAMHDINGYKDIEYAKGLFKRIDQNGNRTKRLKIIKKFGYDVKFAYNVVRLLEEVHQILEEGDLDLTRSRNMLKSIRKGEWSMSKIQEFFDNKYPVLERAYENSKLPHTPREDEIRNLLTECIHMHYGDLKSMGSISVDSAVQNLVLSLQDDVNRLAKLIK